MHVMGHSHTLKLLLRAVVCGEESSHTASTSLVKVWTEMLNVLTQMNFTII